MQKKLLVSLAVIATSTVVHAEDSSMNSLSYRVKEKGFQYELGMDFGKTKFNTSKVDSSLTGAAAIAATEKMSFENSQTRWSNDFSYGISDTFSVSLGLDLSLKNALKQTAGSTGSTIAVGSSGAVTATSYSNAEMKNDGLEDIRLSSSYRYMNDSVKADLLIGLAISGKGKTAATIENAAGTAYVTSTGDAKSGGSSIQLGTQLSGVVGSFEVAGVLGLNYKMKKKTTIVGGDINAAGTAVADIEKENKANMDFALGVEGQYNITSSFAIGANVVANFAAKEEAAYSVYEGGATRYDVTAIDKAHTDLTIGFSGKYQVASNVDLGLNYSHMSGADVDGSIVAKPTTGTTLNYTTTSTDRKDDRFGFNVAVRF